MMQFSLCGTDVGSGLEAAPSAECHSDTLCRSSSPSTYNMCVKSYELAADTLLNQF